MQLVAVAGRCQRGASDECNAYALLLVAVRAKRKKGCCICDSTPCLHCSPLQHIDGLSTSPEPPTAALRSLSLRSGRRGRGGARASLGGVRGEKRAADVQAHEAAADGGVEAPARPSKLAALAASRAAKRQAATSPVDPSPAPSASPAKTSKPLSKLQQRAQANLLARQQRQMAASTLAGDGAKPEDLETDDLTSVPLLPNGEQISHLFPVSPEAITDGHTPQTVLGSVAGSALRSYHSTPGQPFLAPDHLEAFQKPSPDDIVLNARAGTKLGQR